MPLRNWNELTKDAAETAGSFEPLDNGTYDFKIIESSYKKSQSGKDGYNITAEVESGPNKGRRVWNTFYVSPDSPVALGIFFRHFEALGLSRKDFFSTNPSDDQIVQALNGRRFRGTVDSSREYQGKKQTDLKDVQPPAGPPPASVGPAAPSGTAPAPVAVPAPAPAAPAAPAPTQDPWAGATVPNAGAWSTPPAPPAPPAAPAAPAAPVAAPPVPDLSGPAGDPPF